MLTRRSLRRRHYYHRGLGQLGTEEADDAGPTAEVHHRFVPQGGPVANDDPPVRLRTAPVRQHFQVQPLRKRTNGAECPSAEI